MPGGAASACSIHASGKHCKMRWQVAQEAIRRPSPPYPCPTCCELRKDTHRSATVKRARGCAAGRPSRWRDTSSSISPRDTTTLRREEKGVCGAAGGGAVGRLLRGTPTWRKTHS